MTTPGWYPDYDDEDRLRYHDGTNWTEHVHAQDSVMPAASASSGPAQDSAGGAAPGTGAARGQDPWWVQIVAFPLLGIFAGIVIGGMIFNAVGAITPVTEYDGTVRNIDIEYSSSSNSTSTTRLSYVISGSTSEGQEWRIYNEDAYDVLSQEGYPQPVRVFIGDWTGTAERVVGRSFEVNQQNSTGRFVWPIAAVLLALLGLFVARKIQVRADGGPTAAGIFFVFMAGPGLWLGFQLFQWVQSG